MSKDKICVKDLFKESYTIPIYQRNFAWGEDEIHQLIDDIISFGKNKYSEQYYLGLLVVGSGNNNEVVDGQQRLTTLYLIFKYLDLLNEEPGEGALLFECRDKSNRTLRLCKCDIENQDDTKYKNEYDVNLIQAYNLYIKKYLESYNCNEKIKEYLNSIYIIKRVLPSDTDLNHYFELMNTRGEQLEKTDIIKSKLIDVIVKDKKEKNKIMEMEIINIIWQACQNMDSYVQMNFDINIRKIIFGNNWDRIVPNNYNKLIKLIKDIYNCKNNQNSDENYKTLKDIFRLPYKEEYKYNKDASNKRSERFESILSFANFLLQVNKTINKNIDKTNNEMLDDKELLNTLEKWCESAEKAKEFIYNILKFRFIYDKYIIKRDYVNKEFKDGEWSLKHLEKAKGKQQPQYDNNTFKNENQKLIIVLESCLRITYTSPKTMDWIYKLMNYIDVNGDKDKDVLKFIESIAINKVKESNYKECCGFNIERIVYTYLDYILYRDNIINHDGNYVTLFKKKLKNENENWNFIFRNSVEHFFPQHPNKDNKDECKYWIDGDKFTKNGEKALNSFGNLALVTVSANSILSNMFPIQKITENFINQSLKLIIMKSIVEKNNGDWTPKLVEEHEKEMYEILNEELIINS